jgi:hypothetical protein
VTTRCPLLSVSPVDGAVVLLLAGYVAGMPFAAGAFRSAAASAKCCDLLHREIPAFFAIRFAIVAFAWSC